MGASLLAVAKSIYYILRLCKYFGYPKEQLTKLFDLLIMSLVCTELSFGERHIKVNTFIALTSFLSVRSDSDTATNCMQ